MKKQINLTRLNKNEKTIMEDWVADETAVTIAVNGQELITFLCTANHLEDLAVGFLIGEGLIKDSADIKEITFSHDENLLDVRADNFSKVAAETMGKRYLTSGCGKGTSFYKLMDSRKVKLIETENLFKFEHVQSGIKTLQKQSTLFDATGAVHACALCQQDQMLVLREDIGRHNAADKVLGWFYKQQLAAEDVFFVTTGRISSEILLKVAKAGIPLLVSRSAPTGLAVDLSRQINITMIGFLRGNRANIYSGEERVSSK